MKLMICRSIGVLVTLFILSCSSSAAVDDEPAHTEATDRATPEVRNIILVIGDGMGPQQIGLLQQYARQAPNSIYEGRPTAWEMMADQGVFGMAATEAQGVLTVDSACSATHLATGTMAALEAVGVDVRGERVPTIVEVARELGKSTGLVSDTRITHATPAAFAAHTTHRSRENEIAEQMLHNQVDVMLSGGLRHFLPRSVAADDEVAQHYLEMIDHAYSISSSRDDERDLLAEARDGGYELAFDRHQLSQTEGDRLLGLFSHSGMLDAIAERRSRDDVDRREPTLVEMSRIALERLDRNEEGFFLMIEAGQIDWAAHNNDAGTLLHEMIRMDETLAMLHQWAQGRNDTLIIVTADHETGGFGFSYSGVNLPEPVQLPGSVFDGQVHRPDYNFGSVHILDRLFEQKLSFSDIFRKFYDGGDHSPAALQSIVNDHSSFEITLDDAEAILRDRPNPYRDQTHPYLKAETIPDVQDFSAFYVYGEESRRNLLGRAMATEQNVVWSTGTHTHTPVPVVAWGPDHVTAHFDRYLHLSDVGQIMIALLGGTLDLDR